MQNNQAERIGIIGAMVIETEGLLAEMENKQERTISGVTFTEGTLCGKDVVVATCGVGKVFAAICARISSVMGVAICLA